MKMLGKFTSGNCTETGCCDTMQGWSKAHSRGHKREIRRYKAREKREWKRQL